MDTYNGHKNWETWLLHSHNYHEDIAEAIDLYGRTIASAIDCKNIFEDVLSETLDSVVMTDILGGFISEVDWESVAESVNEILESK